MSLKKERERQNKENGIELAYNLRDFYELMHLSEVIFILIKNTPKN